VDPAAPCVRRKDCRNPRGERLVLHEGCRGVEGSTASVVAVASEAGPAQWHDHKTSLTSSPLLRPVGGLLFQKPVLPATSASSHSAPLPNVAPAQTSHRISHRRLLFSCWWLPFLPSPSPSTSVRAHLQNLLNPAKLAQHSIDPSDRQYKG
jgi:hypothetical protein